MKFQQSLKQKGLYFVGIDIIGDYITEINVTPQLELGKSKF